MEIRIFDKIKFFLLRGVGHFLNHLLAGYRWRGFLPRIGIVAILFKINSYNIAVHQSATGGMKLFLLTCAILAYAIYKLIFDYTKWGIELERERRNKL